MGELISDIEHPVASSGRLEVVGVGGGSLERFGVVANELVALELAEGAFVVGPLLIASKGLNGRAERIRISV